MCQMQDGCRFVEKQLQVIKSFILIVVPCCCLPALVHPGWTSEDGRCSASWPKVNAVQRVDKCAEQRDDDKPDHRVASEGNATER